MPTLFTLAGGEPAVTALADAFYRRVLADPLLLPPAMSTSFVPVDGEAS